MAKPIQISAATSRDGDTVYVLMDDGTIYETYYDGYARLRFWHKLDDAPWEKE